MHAAAPIGQHFTPGQVVYEMAMTLAGGRQVSHGLYDRAVEVLGHESIFYAVPAGSPGLAR